MKVGAFGSAAAVVEGWLMINQARVAAHGSAPIQIVLARLI